MENDLIWKSIAEVPSDAKKPFNKGFRGDSIEPIWRMKRLTEMFGPVGQGWGFHVTKRWREDYGSDTVVFVSGYVWWCRADVDGVFKCPECTGGENVKRDPDEAYKKAETDAFGRSAVYLGLASDVYWGHHDGDKYQSNGSASSAGQKRNQAKVAPKSSPPKDVSDFDSDDSGDGEQVTFYFGKFKGKHPEEMAQSSDGIRWLQWWKKKKEEDPPQSKVEQQLFVATLQALEDAASSSEGDGVKKKDSETAESEVEEFF